MKKSLMIIMAFVLSLLSLTCFTANASDKICSQSHLNSTSEIKVNYLTKVTLNSNRNITKQQAIKIVKRKLLPLRLKKLSFSASMNNRQWLVEVSSPAHAGLSHVQGFYLINQSNGNLYVAFASNSDNLLPLTNNTFVYESANEYGSSSYYSTKLLNSAMKSKGEYTFYYHLMKRGNKIYYCVAYLPSNRKSGLYDFYMINKTSHTIYKWNVKNDKLILYKK